MRELRDINQVMTNADAEIAAQINKVTKHLRKILVAGGVPADIANKYSAETVTGGEWILNDEDNELSLHDYQIKNNEYVVMLVKKLEGLS